MLILAQPITDPLSPLLFYVLAALMIASAWAVVITGNIVRMAVYLLLTLLGAAGMYFLLEAELLAAIQLIVYAGGTLILIVFGVMLTSRNPRFQLAPSRGEAVLAGVIAAAVAVGLLTGLAHSELVSAPAGEAGEAVGYATVETIGRALLSRFLVPFEVAAVLLLVVMIAAAYMARRRSRMPEH